MRLAEDGVAHLRYGTITSANKILKSVVHIGVVTEYGDCEFAALRVVEYVVYLVTIEVRDEGLRAACKDQRVGRFRKCHWFDDLLGTCRYLL